MNVPPDCRKARCRQRPGSASVFQLLLLRRRGSVRACDRYSAVWTHHGRGLRVVAAGSPPRDKIGNNDACRRLARHESACRDHDGIFLLRRRNGGGLHVRWRRPGLSLPERAAVSISLHRRPGPYREPMPTGASTVSRQVPQNPLAARCRTAHAVTRRSRRRQRRDRRRIHRLSLGNGKAIQPLGKLTKPPCPRKLRGFGPCRLGRPDRRQRRLGIHRGDATKQP